MSSAEGEHIKQSEGGGQTACREQVSWAHSFCGCYVVIYCSDLIKEKPEGKQNEVGGKPSCYWYWPVFCLCRKPMIKLEL